MPPARAVLTQLVYQEICIQAFSVAALSACTPVVISSKV